MCPIRTDLYSQAFDELIRQSTLNQAERGLLLLRVRNELRMTVAAYQVAYESAIAFAMRAALGSEVHQRALKARRAGLQGDIAALKTELASIESKCDQTQKDAAVARAEDVSCFIRQHTLLAIMFCLHSRERGLRSHVRKVVHCVILPRTST